MGLFMPEKENAVGNVPESNWNYRVLEFVTEDGESWRSIHEVYYDKGIPRGYSEQPAAVVWDPDDSDASAQLILERMRGALAKPILTEKDFHTNGSGSNDLPSNRSTE